MPASRKDRVYPTQEEHNRVSGRIHASDHLPLGREGWPASLFWLQENRPDLAEELKRAKARLDWAAGRVRNDTGHTDRAALEVAMAELEKAAEERDAVTESALRAVAERTKEFN